MIWPRESGKGVAIRLHTGPPYQLFKASNFAIKLLNAGKISQDGDIYTTEIGKCNKPRLCFSLNEPALQLEEREAQTRVLAFALPHGCRPVFPSSLGFLNPTYLKGLLGPHKELQLDVAG